VPCRGPEPAAAAAQAVDARACSDQTSGHVIQTSPEIWKTCHVIQDSFENFHSQRGNMGNNATSF
jgi:hypothetical protein